MKTLRKLKLFYGLAVALYLSSLAGWHFFHEQIHPTGEVSHSVQDEKSSCHRSVYHGEKDNHESHLSFRSVCQDCGLSAAPLHIPVQTSSTIVVATGKEFDSQSPPTVVPVVVGHEASRAPPVL